MKARLFLAFAIATIIVSGCSSKQGSAQTRPAAKVQPASARRHGDWTEVVTPTADGGFVMGNPDAKVKLLEFGSMTCPHCKAFDDEGVPHLLDYVKSGELSWEFRNYVRDAFDVTASLIARCNGAASFFPLTRALYDDQQKWMGQIEKAPADQLKSMEDNQQFDALAKVAGLQQWAAARGLPQARSSQCLSNAKSVDQLVQMASDTTTQYPDFQGTPSFVINGTMVDAASWDGLEPRLRDALAGRG